MLIAIAVVVVSAVCFVLIRDPMIVAEAGKSLSYRLDYWRGSIRLIQAEPWTGYGVANFQQNYNRIKVVTASESPADPHNFVLETTAAGGLPLLLILLAILAIFFWKTIEVARSHLAPTTPFDEVKKKSEVHWAILVGSLVSCLGILLFESLVGDRDSIVSSMLFTGVASLVGLALFRCNWLASDQNTAVTCMLASTVLLVHLLASGGWMQPGVMNSFCVLVGVAFGMEARGAELVGGSRIATRSRNPLYPITCLLLAAVAAAGFVRTMCLPVLAASGAKSMAANSPNSVQDANDWLEIIQLDVHDPELPSIAANRLVELLGNRNLSESTRQKYGSVLDTCCEAYLKRDTNQWVSFAECGRWNAILADDTTETKGASGNTQRACLSIFCEVCGALSKFGSNTVTGCRHSGLVRQNSGGKPVLEQGGGNRSRNAPRRPEARGSRSFFPEKA